MAQALPRNADVAERLELLADLLELDGEASFRVVAYRRAATRIRETAGSVAELALAGKAKDLSGIGRTIEEKIVQLIETGDIEALAKRRAGVPPEVVLFMRLPGLGPKTAAKIWRDLGIETLEELETAAKAGQLRTLPGLGPRTEERIVAALAEAAAAVDEPTRTLLGRALPAVEAVVSTLLEHAAADRVSAAGSIRRRRETVRDLDLIATSPAPAELTGYFTKLAWVVAVEAHGDSKAVVVSNDGLRFDLRVVPPESYGNLLQHFTGSARHNVALREAAVRRGLSVSEYGVEHVESGEVFRTTSEEELYEHLGYAWIPPELREDGGELQAARDGDLPTLVEAGELRGDLHSHTTWSTDAKGSLEEMVAAARARGYEYLAVTDHAHYLREGKLERQQEEIDALAAARGAVPDPARRGGQHPGGRDARPGRRAARALRLGRRLAARCLLALADRADPRSHGAPGCRRHRPPDHAQAEQARGRGHRPGARHRPRARHRHVPRDQLTARPARPARRRRAGRRRGRRITRRVE